MSPNLIPLAAIIFSLLIPIVGIITWGVGDIRKKKVETELRRLIVENKIDLETAKVLIDEPVKKKKSNKYESLRGACVLIGLGLGALADYLLDIKGIYFWLLIAFGIGIGLLVSFFIELKLQKQEPQEEE